MKETIITPYMRHRMEREEAICDDYNELMAQPGAMATAVTAQIMDKYGIAAASSVYRIRERVEKRRAEQQQEER